MNRVYTKIIFIFIIIQVEVIICLSLLLYPNYLLIIMMIRNYF